MGRHADPDPRWFWRSLAAAAGRALLALAVVTAIFLAVAAVGRDGFPGPLGPDPSADPADDDAPAGPVVAAPPGESGADPQRAAPGGGDAPVATAPAEEPPLEEQPAVVAARTVQVLDSVGDADLLAEVVAALEELGLDVVATGRARTGYAETTVFWSPGFEPEARRLQGEEPRLTVLAENDRLSTEVDLHVVIGADWPR